MSPVILIDRLVIEDVLYSLNVLPSDNSLLFYNHNKSRELHLKYSDDGSDVKLFVNNIDKDFENHLNGTQITAAFDIIRNNKTFVYLFAGRMLCRQELSKEFVKVCDIEDIANWIDCPEITETTQEITPETTSRTTPETAPKAAPETTSVTPELPEKSNKMIIIIGVILGVIILTIGVVALIACLIKRRMDEQRKGPTIRFLENASTEHLRSDVPKPKPMESYEGLMPKTSEPNIAKNKDNTPSDTSITNL